MAGCYGDTTAAPDCDVFGPVQSRTSRGHCVAVQVNSQCQIYSQGTIGRLFFSGKNIFLNYIFLSLMLIKILTTDERYVDIVGG